jgi:hypothetical protein
LTKAVIGIVTFVIVACLGVPVLLLSASTGTGTAGCSFTGISAGPSREPAEGGQWDTDQLTIATIIINRGTANGISTWGQTIALAVAMQESRLRNLPHLGATNDHDSIGVFQQRPSQGWGTPEQLGDPAYQADKFYAKLKTIIGWETMPLTRVAQAVQISAYPDAYAKWTSEAVRLVEQYGNGTPMIGCAINSFGSAEPAPRKPDGSWPDETCSIRPDPTTGSGCITPRLLHLIKQAAAAGFGEPGCYRVDDHGEHPRGRACDWMTTSGGEATGAQKARGDALAAWTVANADRLGIMYVIWYRMIWTDDGRGWHAYNNPFGGNDPSGWHTNHVHVSVL